MSKFLVLAAVAFVLWLLLEGAWARVRISMGASARPLSPPTPQNTARNPPAPAAPAPELVLVRCAGCGVHVPSPQVVAGGAGPLCDQCRQPRQPRQPPGREARG